MHLRWMKLEAVTGNLPMDFLVRRRETLERGWKVVEWMDADDGFYEHKTMKTECQRDVPLMCDCLD